MSTCAAAVLLTSDCEDAEAEEGPASGASDSAKATGSERLTSMDSPRSVVMALI